jgi:hypothetical protein
MLSVVLMSLSLVVYASAEDEFRHGAAAFNKGDYAAAVEKFESAESQGMHSAALYYNLASSYFKLSDFDSSKKYFKRVRGYEGMQHLADYNLGLIALKQKDDKAARNKFTSVSKNSSDEKLVALSRKQIKKISSPKAKKTKTVKQQKWSVYLSGAGGYDDNVNFSPLGIGLGRADSFSEIIASADYFFTGNRKSGWKGEVFLYDRNYRSEDRFDEYEYGLGLTKYLTQSEKWRSQFFLNASKINYAKEDYQRITKAGASAKYSLSRYSGLYLRYAFEDIKSENIVFDYLEGWRQKMRAEYRQYNKKDIRRVYYELELNNRNDLTIPTGIRAGDYSYSPTRHVLRGKYTYVFSKKWYLTGDLAYRISDYPATANQDRKDDRFKASLYGEYRFSRNFKLRLKATRTDNRSTEDVFDYKRNVYSLSLNKLF